MVNDLGVDPDEWFDAPRSEKEKDYITDEYAPCDVEYDGDEMPVHYKEIPSSVENPKPMPKPKKEEKTMHEKMYEIATARYNPFSLGGSENCDSDITCNLGGSEEAHK
tara:strand:- start:2 stop:325 length:324 start_codon:yes stop_codon:yes gene_type:complete